MHQSGFLNPPGPLTGANITVFWIVNVACLGLVVASIVIAIHQARTRRTWLPILLLASGALWLPNEPFMDTILGFQYASGAPGTIFTLAGRPIPLAVIAVGSMFSMFTWIIYRLVIDGRSQTVILITALIAGIIDWPMEMIASHFHVYEYYGHNPTRIFGLPFTSMVQNCFLYLFMAAVVLLVRPYLRGWRALLFLPVIPGCYYAVALLATWPAYLALHARWSTPVFLILGVIAAAMNAYIPITALDIATQVHRGRAGSATTDDVAKTEQPAPAAQELQAA